MKQETVRQRIVAELTDALSDELHEEISNVRTVRMNTPHGYLEVMGDVWSLQTLKGLLAETTPKPRSLLPMQTDNDEPLSHDERLRKRHEFAQRVWWEQPTEYLRRFARKILYIADVRDAANTAISE